MEEQVWWGSSALPFKALLFLAVVAGLILLCIPLLLVLLNPKRFGCRECRKTEETESDSDNESICPEEIQKEKPITNPKEI
ncbi:hypothetical protein CRM22_002429 [Opisthorchis felineus]|uniref:Uncharacterized protein n=1 Tax=Opisthorchis felineus TaxID=147828 RepID=A0A4S2M633_OPIFE|nr:hypothetical protein CRM22_002429 [Opisthorchis felineus]